MHTQLLNSKHSKQTNKTSSLKYKNKNKSRILLKKKKENCPCKKTTRHRSINFLTTVYRSIYMDEKYVHALQIRLRILSDRNICKWRYERQHPHNRNLPFTGTSQLPDNNKTSPWQRLRSPVTRSCKEMEF